mmetsp:Transcript_81293/g.206471  ORF Transcript_81293/g.206471 Transcript_81293/m.206471 type:complete len:313 (+) Transcript_81293:396-1334(+)
MLLGNNVSGRCCRFGLRGGRCHLGRQWRSGGLRRASLGHVLDPRGRRRRVAVSRLRLRLNQKLCTCTGGVPQSLRLARAEEGVNRQRCQRVLHGSPSRGQRRPRDAREGLRSGRTCACTLLRRRLRQRRGAERGRLQMRLQHPRRSLSGGRRPVRNCGRRPAVCLLHLQCHHCGCVQALGTILAAEDATALAAAVEAVAAARAIRWAATPLAGGAEEAGVADTAAADAEASAVAILGAQRVLQERHHDGGRRGGGRGLLGGGVEAEEGGSLSPGLFPGPHHPPRRVVFVLALGGQDQLLSGRARRSGGCTGA